jgi:hypothetical protein
MTAGTTVRPERSAESTSVKLELDVCGWEAAGGWVGRLGTLMRQNFGDGLMQIVARGWTISSKSCVKCAKKGIAELRPRMPSVARFLHYQIAAKFCFQ